MLKAHGKSAVESTLLKGYALNMGRAAQGMPRRVAGARIACLDMNLMKARMQMGVQARRVALRCVARVALSVLCAARPPTPCARSKPRQNPPKTLLKTLLKTLPQQHRARRCW